MRYQPKSTCLNDLARPKSTPEGFIPDRRSVYWVNKMPPQPPTVFDISPHLEGLITTKLLHKDFVPDRPSPIWPISKAALTCPIKEHFIILSQPKKVHENFLPDRIYPFLISSAAIKKVPTERLEVLAVPKKRPDTATRNIRDSRDVGEPIISVSTAALKSSPSGRIKSLAKPRSFPSGFQFDTTGFKTEKKISSNIKIKSNDRLHKLSKPIIRNSIDEEYDPYHISTSALSAIASNRLSELSKPRRKRVV